MSEVVINDREHRRMVNTLCKKRKAIMLRCKELANSLKQRVYLCIYDERLNRVTEYQSEKGFGWRKASQLLDDAQHVGPRVKLALRTYIGDDVNKHV